LNEACLMRRLRKPLAEDADLETAFLDRLYLAKMFRNIKLIFIEPSILFSYDSFVEESRVVR